MATRRPESRTRKDNPAKPRQGSEPNLPSESTEHVYGVPTPVGLHEAIERERGNLSKTESLLNCMALAMEYESDSSVGPYYPDVVRIARDLVRQSINALDSATLEQYLSRNRIRDEVDLSHALH